MGVSPEMLYDMTPEELNFYYEGYNQKEKNAKELLYTAVFFIEWLRHQKEINLKDFLSRFIHVDSGQPKPKKKMTDRQMFNFVKMFCGSLGKKVE